MMFVREKKKQERQVPASKFLVNDKINYKLLA